MILKAKYKIQNSSICDVKASDTIKVWDMTSVPQ